MVKRTTKKSTEVIFVMNYKYKVKNICLIDTTGRYVDQDS